MKTSSLRSIAASLLCATLVLALVGQAARAEHTPREVLVVYNADSPVSKDIAEYYMSKRHVPNSVAVHCADSAVSTGSETLSYDDFTKEIAGPVQAFLAAHPGINFIVLTKGVPIRVVGAPTGDNAPHPLRASVDSTLAAIDYPTLSGVVKASITGSGTVGTAYLNRYYNSHEPFSHAKFGGYLVSRLDGYSEDDAKRLVDESLAADHGVGSGKILFDIPRDFGLGDKTKRPIATPLTLVTSEASWGTWNADMLHAASILEASGIPCEADVTKQFVGNETDLLGYYSWGSNDDHFNAEAYESLRFAPGSIGDTAVSTGARTFLPTKGGQTLIDDLTAHGLSCCQGYVDEPLLDGTSSPTIELTHYLKGYTMAESFYAATAYTGWEVIVLGDPLCCPYTGKTLTLPVMAADFTASHGGLKTESCSESGQDVGTISNGDSTTYAPVDLIHATRFLARVAAPSAGSVLELHLDSPTGPLLATLSVPNTGDWQTWQTAGAPMLKRVRGEHSVSLVYKGGGGDLMNVEWFAVKANNP